VGHVGAVLAVGVGLLAEAEDVACTLALAGLFDHGKARGGGE
jgi:hypothetical protein